MTVSLRTGIEQLRQLSQCGARVRVRDTGRVRCFDGVRVRVSVHVSVRISVRVRAMVRKLYLFDQHYG